MKRYVFFTNSIRNMGGAQMYLRNKMLFLQKHGWEVAVFYFNDGEILIPELKQFKRNRIPELAYPISAISSTNRNRILEEITEGLKGIEHLVFETHVYHMSLWAEKIAELVDARSILYILHESLPSFSSKELNFLRFKIERNEIMNALRFYPILNMYKEDNRDWIMPSYSNVTADIPFVLKYDKSRKTILSLGRLDKPYITPMLHEIVKFAEETNSLVNLFLVGGAADDSYITTIKEYLKGEDKVIPYFFGYMYPVPEIIIKAADVAIASSGSVLVPTEHGIPTIAIDTQDYMAMGIYGITTMNTFVRTTEPQIKTSDLLYNVLIENKFGKIDPRSIAVTLESEKILQKHLESLDTLDAPKEYFDVLSVYSGKDVFKQKAIMMSYKILGENGVAALSKIIHRVIG